MGVCGTGWRLKATRRAFALVVGLILNLIVVIFIFLWSSGTLGFVTISAGSLIYTELFELLKPADGFCVTAVFNKQGKYDEESKSSE